MAKSEYADDFGIGTVVDKVEALLNEFGGSMGDELDDYLDDFTQKEYEWAKNTQRYWYRSAPWATGNLRESISTFDEQMPLSITVGVDNTKLMARAGAEVPPKRLWYKKNYYKNTVEIPNNPDYVEWIDENVKSMGREWKAVSAGAENYHSRENNVGTHTPFIDRLWFVYAEKFAKEIFGE